MKQDNRSNREKAESFTKARLSGVWEDIPTEEKEKLITEAEEMFNRWDTDKPKGVKP